MANKQQLQSAGDGTAIPAGYVGHTQVSASLALTTTAQGTWQKCTGDFGTPPAGTYLLLQSGTSAGAAGLVFAGMIINETSGSVTPVVSQAQTVASGTAVGIAFNSKKYVTDGTKTLYAWVRTDGALANVTVTLELIRIA